jgi:hypothetical protein
MALNETFHRGGFMVSEAEKTRSRDQITVLSGQNLKAGAVLGKVAHGSATSVAKGGNTGNGVMGAVTLGVGAQVGDYKLTIIEPAANAGAFIVEDPAGVEVASGTVGVAFSAGGLAFTLADGATDFVSGDQFTITVAAGSGKYKEYNPANTDGSETAVAILYDDCDATSADQQAVGITRQAEVNASELVWFSGASAPQQTTGKTQLALQGLIAR